MAEKQYQVVAEMASHVEVVELGSEARSVHTLYQGAILPDGVPADRLAILLERGIIAPLGDEPLAPNATVRQDPARGADSVTPELLAGGKAEEPRRDPALDAADRVSETVSSEGRVDKAVEPPHDEAASKADRELGEKRAAARAKLPEDGSAPDGRASQATWAEFMVAQGSSYADVRDATKAELVSLHEQRSKS